MDTRNPMVPSADWSRAVDAFSAPPASPGPGQAPPPPAPAAHPGLSCAECVRSGAPAPAPAVTMVSGTVYCGAHAP